VAKGRKKPATNSKPASQTSALSGWIAALATLVFNLGSLFALPVVVATTIHQLVSGLPTQSAPLLSGEVVSSYVSIILWAGETIVGDIRSLVPLLLCFGGMGLFAGTTPGSAARQWSPFVSLVIVTTGVAILAAGPAVVAALDLALVVAVAIVAWPLVAASSQRPSARRLGIGIAVMGATIGVSAGIAVTQPSGTLVHFSSGATGYYEVLGTSDGMVTLRECYSTEVEQVPDGQLAKIPVSADSGMLSGVEGRQPSLLWIVEHLDSHPLGDQGCTKPSPPPFP
jgi:outer membrane protein assembly factor BamB